MIVAPVPGRPDHRRGGGGLAAQPVGVERPVHVDDDPGRDLPDHAGDERAVAGAGIEQPERGEVVEEVDVGADGHVPQPPVGADLVRDPGVDDGDPGTVAPDGRLRSETGRRLRPAVGLHHDAHRREVVVRDLER